MLVLQVRPNGRRRAREPRADDSATYQYDSVGDELAPYSRHDGATYLATTRIQSKTQPRAYVDFVIDKVFSAPKVLLILV